MLLAQLLGFEVFPDLGLGRMRGSNWSMAVHRAFTVQTA